MTVNGKATLLTPTGSLSPDAPESNSQTNVLFLPHCLTFSCALPHIRLRHLPMISHGSYLVCVVKSWVRSPRPWHHSCPRRKHRDPRVSELSMHPQVGGTRSSTPGIKWGKRWRDDGVVGGNEVSALTLHSTSGLHDWGSARFRRGILPIPTLIVVILHLMTFFRRWDAE